MAQTLTHKLKVRFARLTKQYFDERKTVFKDIGDFYTARSQVVHGNNEKKSEAVKKVDMSKIEDYLRGALKIYITKRDETKASHDQIIEILDLGGLVL